MNDLGKEKQIRKKVREEIESSISNILETANKDITELVKTHQKKHEHDDLVIHLNCL